MDNMVFVVGFFVLLFLGNIIYARMQYKKVNADPRWKDTPKTTIEYFAQMYHILVVR